MNFDKLKLCEEKFFADYPLGFESEQMKAAEKKHKPEKMTALARELFDRKNFKTPRLVAEAMNKLISRFSTVFLFEKPEFRDFIHGLDNQAAENLVSGLYRWLYEDEETGFNQLLWSMAEHKIVKQSQSGLPILQRLP